MVVIHLDDETYSEANLREVGAYAYVVHPSTDILLASFVIDDGRTRTRGRWRRGQSYPFAHLDQDEIEIHAWNSQFERLVWWYVCEDLYEWPHLPLESFVCTAARARSTAASPSSLEIAGKFFDRPNQKDMAGHRHMLKMCKPATDKEQLEFIRENGTDEGAKRCHHTSRNIEILHAYCDKDVETEIDIGDILPSWRDDELEQFWEYERINDNGLIVDVQFAECAAQYADEENVIIAKRITELTGGTVTTARQFQRIKAWALPRMSAEAVKITEHYDEGVKKHTFDADARANLLSAHAADSGFLTDEVAEFINILDVAGKSTIAKYQAIAAKAVRGFTDDNWRVHGSYVFAGASQSGRASSKGIQMHNLVRSLPADAPRVIDAFKSGDRERVEAFGQPLNLLSQLVRPTIIGGAKENSFLAWCDWSAIEAIVLPWLSLQPEAEERLAAFRRGEDIYLRTASAICGRKITAEDKFERQAFGKVPELACGYLGGHGAFIHMGKNCGVHLPEEQTKRIVAAWREKNPWAMKFGKACERAVFNCMRNPGASFSAGRLNYIYEPDALDGVGALWTILPSDRRLCYVNPSLEVQKTTYGKHVLCLTAMRGAWRPARGVNEWPRAAIWKGILLENPCQATATGDLLNLALVRARVKYGLIVCGSTHDEIIIETRDPENDVQKLHACMLEKPKWRGVDALPLSAKCGYGLRYKVNSMRGN